MLIKSIILTMPQEQTASEPIPICFSEPPCDMVTVGMELDLSTKMAKTDVAQKQAILMRSHRQLDMIKTKYYILKYLCRWISGYYLVKNSSDIISKRPARVIKFHLTQNLAWMLSCFGFECGQLEKTTWRLYVMFCIEKLLWDNRKGASR